MSSVIIDQPPKLHRQHSQNENTVEAAEADAPNEAVARQIEETAEEVHDAAEDAAKVAQSKGPALTGESVKQAQRDAKAKTDAAVEEGEKDVQAAKEHGASYIEQVKHLAAHAAETVQAYLPTGLGGRDVETPPHEKTSGAASTVERGKEALSGAAPESSQPETSFASPRDIPTTSAPLESGAHTVDTPYSPTTTTKTGTQNIAEIGRTKGSKPQ